MKKENRDNSQPKLKSLKAPVFVKLFGKLEPEIQQLAIKTFKQWISNPDSVEVHNLERTKGMCKVELGYRHRAIAAKTRDADGNEVFTWMWIGSHESYNKALNNTKEMKLIASKVAKAREGNQSNNNRTCDI